MSSDGSMNSYEDEWEVEYEEPDSNLSLDLVRYVKLPHDRYQEVRCLLY